MIITPKIKERVVAELLTDMKQRGYTSQTDYVAYIRGQLGIKFDKAAFSQIKKLRGEAAVITPLSWLKLARHFNALDNGQWNKADTGTFITITTALDLCKNNGIWQVLCDRPGIGKTYAARYYADHSKESVVYVDCSLCLSKSEFIMELARQLGVDYAGTYARTWRDATDALLLIDRPLLILDEFGDVPDSVITLLKSLYNKADMGDHLALGVYMIGADNLNKRMIDGRKKKKPSYAEFWSRFDDSVNTLNFSETREAFKDELKEEIGLIVDANLPPELAAERELIIDKTVVTRGSRAVRKNINLQLTIKNLNTI